MVYYEIVYEAMNVGDLVLATGDLVLATGDFVLIWPWIGDDEGATESDGARLGAVLGNPPWQNPHAVTQLSPTSEALRPSSA